MWTWGSKMKSRLGFRYRAMLCCAVACAALSARSFLTLPVWVPFLPVAPGLVCLRPAGMTPNAAGRGRHIHSGRSDPGCVDRELASARRGGVGCGVQRDTSFYGGGYRGLPAPVPGVHAGRRGGARGAGRRHPAISSAVTCSKYSEKCLQWEHTACMLFFSIPDARRRSPPALSRLPAAAGKKEFRRLRRMS